MFSFLKKKIKDAISSISRSAQTDSEETIVAEVPEELLEAPPAKPKVATVAKEPRTEKSQKKEIPKEEAKGKKKEEKKKEEKKTQKEEPRREEQKEKKKDHTPKEAEQKSEQGEASDSFSDVDAILAHTPRRASSEAKAAEKEKQKELKSTSKSR